MDVLVSALEFVGLLANQIAQAHAQMVAQEAAKVNVAEVHVGRYAKGRRSTNWPLFDVCAPLCALT